MKREEMTAWKARPDVHTLRGESWSCSAHTGPRSRDMRGVEAAIGTRAARRETLARPTLRCISSRRPKGAAQLPTALLQWLEQPPPPLPLPQPAQLVAIAVEVQRRRLTERSSEQTGPRVGLQELVESTGSARHSPNEAGSLPCTCAAASRRSSRSRTAAAD